MAAWDSLSALTILLFIVGLGVNQEDGCLVLEDHLEPPTPTADIKVMSFGPDEGPPYSIGSGSGAVNGWWPDYFTFDEVKHNNGPDPAKIDVLWLVEDAPPLLAGAQTSSSVDVFTAYRWHALPGATSVRRWPLTSSRRVARTLFPVARVMSLAYHR